MLIVNQFGMKPKKQPKKFAIMLQRHQEGRAMPDKEYLESLLSTWQKAIQQTSTMSKEDLIENAISYIKNKNNYERIKRAFIVDTQEKREVIFMSGMSGVGKSEFVSTLNSQNTLNVIAPDDIRQLLPGYTGGNAHLFQKATSTCVSKMFSDVIGEGLPFLMDTNLANIEIAEQNIIRVLKRGYTVTLYFIHRTPAEAFATALHREKTEGRHVPTDIFVQKGIGAIETFTTLSEKYSLNSSVGMFVIKPEGVVEISGANGPADFRNETKNALDDLRNFTHGKQLIFMDDELLGEVAVKI
jgi:UDP-N-acetylglucosamine kinase